MARKREINYFKEIKNDEELNEFLKQDGLLILDVYQDLFGPCLSLHPCLEKNKLLLMDSDKVQLANCDAFKIEKLARFRSKCQPTIVFCNYGKIVDVMYGANIPLLSRTIQNQLELAELFIDRKIERVFYEFDEPLPFERDEIDRQKSAHEEAVRNLREKIEAETKEKFDNVIELFRENGSDSGVTFFLPHVAEIAYKKTSETAKWLSMLSKARKIIQITPEISDILNHYLENPIDSEVMNYLFDKEILAVLWSVDGDVEKVLGQFVMNVSEPLAVKNDEGIRISGEFQPRILDPLIIQLDDENIADIKSESEKSETTESEKRDSRRSERISSDRGDLRRETILGDVDVSVDENKLVIPPVWTSTNKEGNALLMYFFFAKQFEHFLPPEEEPIPDHLLMIFPAWHHETLLEMCENFPEQLLDFGFFTENSNENNHERESFELICKTVEKYEQLLHSDSDKIILKVAKRTSHLSLALTTMSPLYVSHNVVKGEKECSEIFNEEFYASQDVVEDEEENET